MTSAFKPRPMAPVGDVPLFSVEMDAASNECVQDFLASDMWQIINYHALGNAIFAFSDSPMFAELEEHGVLDIAKIVERHGLSQRHAVGMARYFVTQGLLTEEVDQVFYPTPKGRSAFAPGIVGLLQMYRGGYGNLMVDAKKLLDGSQKYGTDTSRDGYWVAKGSSAMTRRMLDEAPYRVLESSGMHRVGDLGCGAGDFLMDFVRRNPKNRGVGVDLSPEAIAAARARAKEAGLADRVRFEVGDCFDPAVLHKHCHGDIDVFFSFGMEHELLRDGDQAVTGHIDRLAEVFPGCGFLLGEPMLNMTPADGMFYWIHILSHQGIPRDVAGWVQILKGLKKAKLARVFQPDHRRLGAYFDIRF